MIDPDDERDTREAGLGGTLEPGRLSALLLVDPVRAYVDPACPLYAGVEESVKRMRVVLTEARAAGIIVAITTMSIGTDGSDAGIFSRKVPALRAYLPGSPFGEFIDGLAPASSEIRIDKQYPSAFFGTSLAANLRARGVDTVFIAGLSTSGCIRATTTDALQNGFVPIVVEDAVGDRLASVHEANLFDIRAKIGEVWPSQRVVQHWSSKRTA